MKRKPWDKRSAAFATAQMKIFVGELFSKIDSADKANDENIHGVLKHIVFNMLNKHLHSISDEAGIS